jgi:hypothetical protein
MIQQDRLQEQLKLFGLDLPRAIMELNLAVKQSKIEQIQHLWYDWQYHKQQFAVINGPFNRDTVINESWLANRLGEDHFQTTRVVVQTNDGRFFGAECPFTYTISKQGQEVIHGQADMKFGQYLEECHDINDLSGVLAIYNYECHWSVGGPPNSPRVATNEVQVRLPNFDWQKLVTENIERVKHPAADVHLALGAVFGTFLNQRPQSSEKVVHEVRSRIGVREKY